jgi:hypothetical protein
MQSIDTLISDHGRDVSTFREQTAPAGSDWGLREAHAIGVVTEEIVYRMHLYRRGLVQDLLRATADGQRLPPTQSGPKACVTD